MITVNEIVVSNKSTILHLKPVLRGYTLKTSFSKLSLRVLTIRFSISP